MNSNKLVTLSIVSHGQASLIKLLLNDIYKLELRNIKILITINIPEDEAPYQEYPLNLKIIRNNIPKGFGANHNAAFLQSQTKWFAIINPDIRLINLDFDSLLKPFKDKSVAAIAPIVLSGEGTIEDSARHFPTLWRFFKRLLLKNRILDYKVEDFPYQVDWVAGMFVVFRREAYKTIGGFDDRRFFMYLEDADICFRLMKNGWKTLVNPSVSVVHLAQRKSLRNLKHMRWHAVSAFRFITGI